MSLRRSLDGGFRHAMSDSKALGAFFCNSHGGVEPGAGFDSPTQFE